MLVSYEHMIIKQAISVTLHRDNVTWLKGRTNATGCRSVSELMDRLVTAARMGGKITPSRSVAGTIEIHSSDPSLEGADAAVRNLYEMSIGRPLVVRHPDKTGRQRKPSRLGRG